MSRYKKTIDLEQFKDAMRFTYGDQYHLTDLTDYDNWVGFTHSLEQAWRNLDKRTGGEKKAEFRRTPKHYKPFIRLPRIGQLYREQS